MYAERLPRLNRAIARVNRVGLNRLTHFIAPWAPGWAVVVHRGRKSGRTYRTPLWVFRKDGGFVIALTYGQRTQWLGNVMAAGGCEIETRGKRYRARAPEVYKDKSRKDMPIVIRLALCLLGVDDFLSLKVEAVSPRTAAPAS